ncbi:hypothetical protein EZJ49_10780 [Bdellovibrio bacteriovorus]|uniref:hypothetical protein n=1 Tax=Bdellovibrio bacteriovorus TaxID=959 RepID=UPI0021CFF78B|nr:hypothetical protein [Bdellovibrio bacteriovorus]UXR63559.1 hypothetical protein EZJ49_10780 [Bdellovibrio bacteriovorus]
MKQIIFLFIGLVSFLVSPAFAEAPEYFEKMNQFARLTEHQIISFENYVQEVQKVSPQAQAQLSQSLKLQQKALWGEIERLKSLYDKSFVAKTATKEDRKALVYHESNLSIAVHRQLVLLHDFLSEVSPKNAEKKLAVLVRNMDAISVDLQKGKSIEVPAGMGINQVFQSGQKVAVSVCKLLAGFCTRKSLSGLMDSLNEGNFLRSKQYELIGVEEAKKAFPANEKSVFILIGNHDQPLMDIALARKVSLALGSDHHVTMTRKSVYPIPPPVSAGDVVFVVDNDPKSNPVQESLDILAKNITEKSHNRVSLAVYPEGMLPYTGGQMPMTVKEGAFVIARKMAHQLSQQGVSVYLVRMKSNIIEHLTAADTIPARVVMESVEKVPDTAIDRSRPDEWIERNRLQAENSFNSHRGKTQIDIFNLDKVPYSKIPLSIEIRACSKVFVL